MKILIAEDNEINRKLFSVLLKGAGHEIIEAGNGMEAVNLAKENVPHLILMDIQMPVMNGIEANKILKAAESTAKIPVVALTAYAMPDDRKKFIMGDFDGYIPKPVDVKMFMATIKSILGGQGEIHGG